MGQITVNGARQFQRMLFGKQTDLLDSFFLALIRVNVPTIFNVGDELDEPIADNNAYARAEIINGSNWWMENVASSITNAQDIVFPSATADWGTIKYWALCNTAVGGDVFFVGKLPAAQNIIAGDRAVVPVGAIDISISVLFQAS